MYEYNQRDFKIYATISNDCTHIKGQLKCRCACVERKRCVRHEAYAFNARGVFVGMDPKSVYHRKWSITCLPREEGAHVLTNSCMILLQDADLNIDTVLSFLYYGLFGLREQKKLI
jgi:hypothetical protein